MAYPTTPGDAPLSKNQQKKMRRYEAKKVCACVHVCSCVRSACPALCLFLSPGRPQKKNALPQARRSALKSAAKASRAETTAARRAAACARIDSMTAAEKVEWRAAKAAKQADRRAAAAARTARLEAAQSPGATVPHVVVDLCDDYTALMTPRERTSLASQLRACYATNAACPHPVRLTFAGWGPGWEAALGGAGSGMHAWRVGREGGDFAAAATAAGASKVVYLSADAPGGGGGLAALEPGAAYVIGGLVDRNRHRGAAAARAACFPGVSSARLPIGEHATLAASAVLTVDQVFKLLSAWWAEKQTRTGAAAGAAGSDGGGSQGGGGGDQAGGGGEDAAAVNDACWAVAVREAVPARKVVGGGGGKEGSDEG